MMESIKILIYFVKTRSRERILKMNKIYFLNHQNLFNVKSIVNPDMSKLQLIILKSFKNVVRNEKVKCHKCRNVFECVKKLTSFERDMNFRECAAFVRMLSLFFETNHSELVIKIQSARQSYTPVLVLSH